MKYPLLIIDRQVMMTHPPVINSTISKLLRAEIGGVNAHTLPIAVERAERDHVPFETLSERQVALTLLERAGYPESMAELGTFLNVGQTMKANALVSGEITEQYAPAYMRWLAGFLDDPEQNVQKNARILLYWLVTNRASAIATDQRNLDNLRRVASDSKTSWRNAAFLVYALGVCGTPEDYETVTRQAEIVIEHDREHIDLVAEGLYKLHPPALVNALEFFLERTDAHSKQFLAGLQLLAKVAEIDDKAFWNTYYDKMDEIINKLNEIAGQHPIVERILDLVEKQMALAQVSDE